MQLIRPHSLAVILLLLLALPPAALAQQAQEDASGDKVVLVLDASGSMWGQIAAKPKIEIAKQVAKDLVDSWDPAVALGLTVYGHRRKADCSDIQTVVPVGPLNKGDFLKALGDLNAVGKTPLTAAVRQAAKELKYNEDRATVILVSDGIETCDSDPCAAAKELEASGVDFTAHVIGFDISDQSDLAQLKCIAENTGGTFLEAKDADSLKSSLQQAVQETAKAAKEKQIELVAVHTPGGEPVKKVQWNVYRLPEEGEGEPQAVAKKRIGSSRLSLEPGRYRAEVESLESGATGKSEFEVTADTTRQEVVIEQDGIVALRAVNAPGETPLSGVHWEIFDIPSSEISKPKKLKFIGNDTPEVKLLPGSYTVKVKSTKGKATAEQKIEVIGGKRSTEEIVLAEEGILELIPVTKEGGEPLDNMWWEVHTLVPPDSVETPQKVAYGSGATPTYRLLPGSYLAKVKSTKGKATAEREIEVVAGKKNRYEVIVPEEGIIELSAVHAEQGAAIDNVYWQVWTSVPEDSMDQPEKVAYGQGATPSYKLLPGTYVAKVKSQKGTAAAEQQIEVVAGKRTKVAVLFPEEGKVSLKAVEKEGGEPMKAFWTLFRTEGEELKKRTKVHYGGGNTPTYLAVPGTYVAEAKIKGATFSKEIEIVAGKAKSEELVITAE